MATTDPDCRVVVAVEGVEGVVRNNGGKELKVRVLRVVDIINDVVRCVKSSFIWVCELLVGIYWRHFVLDLDRF